MTVVASSSCYESATGFRDEKRATLLPLLQTPQDPIGDVSMTESFLLALYFNTLHAHFHVDGLKGHQRHHQSWYLLVKISGCGDSPWGPWITSYTAPNCTGSYRTILYPLQKESCIGSNTSNAFFDHVQCN
jgi:hypothetical protein